jgi:hypothetical protein
MKKALVVFLILAVAGGLFAQTTVKFTGSLRTGLAIGFTDEEGDAGKPKVGFIQNRGENGTRADLTAQIRSGPDNQPYGAFGADVTFRGRENTFLGTDGIVALVPTINAFWQPNSILWLQVGTGGGGGYGTMGGIGRSQDIVDTNGLKIKLTPISGLSIGGQLYYGAGSVLFENMNYGLGATYTVPDLLKVAANLRYLAQNKDDKTEKIRFGAGANFLGLSGLGLTTLAADFGTWGFGTDDFFMGIGEAVGFSAGALTLSANAQQFIWLGEGSKDVMPMRFHGEVAYKVSPVVTLGVEGRYLIGAKPNFNFRNAGELGGVDNVAAFSAKDTSALGISPRITFNVGPEVVLGYNLQMDMSDGASGRTMQHLIYTGLNISF